MSLITFRYNFKNLRIFFYENLLYLILLFNIFPLFFFIGIPHPKLFLISLAFPFLFLRNFKEFIFTKGDKLSSLMMIFIIYQVFTLISAFFYYDLNYFDNANRFYETIFVSSIYSFSPLIVVYIVKRFDLKKLNQTKNFGSFLYSALGIFILFSIILKFKLDGLEFDFFRARDILSIGVNGEVISSPKGIPEGRFSLSTLYYYFGRSNTIAPFLIECHL